MTAFYRVWGLAFVLLLAAAAGELRAETFLLASGGRIEGEIANPDESPRVNYVIKTESGGQVTLARAQVKEILRQTDAEAEYEKVRPQFADTAEGQFALAEWCREHGLERLRNKHLKRVIELDPGHKEAHRLLHHFQGKSQREFWEKQGYVLYQGDWMSPQEVELKERSRNAELAAKAWRRQLKIWRGWLNSDRSREAIAQINQINDPYAVPALTDALAKETAIPIRKRYIEALARIASAPAWQVLCQFSLSDDNEEVRQTCLDYLGNNPSPAAVSFYIKHLKDPENKIVNRAANGLLRMKDRRAIGPLIEALVTSHKRVIQPAQAGGMSATFGLGGYSFGTPKAQVVTESFKNESVLEALVQLTNMNFQYEVGEWKTWRATQKKKTQNLNARRD